MNKIVFRFCLLFLMCLGYAVSQRGANTLETLMNSKAINYFESWNYCDFEGDNVGKQVGYRVDIKDESDRITRLASCFVGSPNKNYVDYFVVYMDTRSNYKEQMNSAGYYMGFVTSGCFSLSQKTIGLFSKWLDQKLLTGQIGEFETSFPEMGVSLEIEHYQYINQGSFTIKIARYGKPATPAWARYCTFN